MHCIFLVQQCYAIEMQSHQHRVKANRKEFKHKSEEAAKISKVVSVSHVQPSSAIELRSILKHLRG